MKKLVLFAAVVFGLSTTNAQKNSILLGGNVGYNHTENKFGGDEQKYDTYEWAPVLGYQFADNWAIGATAKFSKIDQGDVHENGTSIGGFVRYTRPFNETFAIYADLGAGWQEERIKSNGVELDKADGFYIGFTPALFINFKNNFGLNFSIGGIEYNHLKQKGTNAKSNGVDVTFGNSFNIGISKNFAL
jgi:hypothetical protein